MARMHNPVSRRRFLRSGLCVSGAFLTEDRLFGRQAAPASTGAADSALVEDLVAANRILAQERIVDGYGHVSVRHNRAANRFLLSRSLAPALVTSDDIIEYDLESSPVNSRGRASYTERFIHGEIYKARPDVNAIVHCHTESLIPFANSSTALRPMFHMSSFVAEGIPVFEIRDLAGMTNMLISDARLGRALATTLGNKPAALMRGHGAVIVGDSILIAVARSIYLDTNARVQAQAMALGGPIKYLDPEEARLWNSSNSYDRAWDMWKRRAMAK